MNKTIKSKIQAKSKLEPQLRFPGFSKELWEEKELKELGELINGLTYSPNDVRAKGLLVLRSSNIQNGSIDLNDCVYVRADVKGANLTAPNDILVCVRNGSKALIGKNAIIPSGLPLATHGAFMTVFRATSPEFVFQLFQSDSYDEQVKADLGATINSINGKNFLKYQFSVPKNPKEQQKIASCLSSLDEVIAAHTQKLEALKEHKKGLMQNLFPQEGESVPRYRFPEFRKNADWVEKKLGDIAENLDSFRIPITSTQRKKGDIPYYGASGIIDYVEDYIFNESLLCISEDGANLIDRNYPIAFSIHGKTWVNNHSHVLRFENINTQIIVETYINSINIEDFLTGMAQPKLNRGKLDIIPIPLPKNTKEQEKIAKCLSSLGLTITALTEKIVQLKLHKTGLMQGLFPKNN